MTSRKITRLLENTMTVAELIEELGNYSPEAKVLLTADYGDRTHTVQALAITSVEDLDGSGETLATTGYSSSGVEVAEAEDGEDEEHDFDVVVLR